jgi:DNA-binding NarL/FixJ family response regulator
LLYWARAAIHCMVAYTMAGHAISTDALAQPPDVRSAAKHILIVDDNEYFLPVLRACLETQGYEVCGEAADGVAAIERAKELKPDLIVMDMAMPRLNGMEAAAILKNLLPKIPVVLLTIHDEEVKATSTAAFGIKAVVSKADGISALTACLRGLLGSAEQRNVRPAGSGDPEPTNKPLSTND